MVVLNVPADAEMTPAMLQLMLSGADLNAGDDDATLPAFLASVPETPAAEMAGLSSSSGPSALPQHELRRSSRQLDVHSAKAAVAMQRFARGRLTRRRFRSLWTKVRNAVRSTGGLLRRVRIRRMSELPYAVAREGGKVQLSVEGEQELKRLRLWEQDVQRYGRDPGEDEEAGAGGNAVPARY